LADGQAPRVARDVTKALQKYFDDSYFFAGDRLVIVEPKMRRIVAIIPNVG
jgi:hypothetical protein